MRVKIYNEQKEIIEEELILRLKREGGDVQLVAVDEDGKDIAGGILLAVTSEGTVRLYGSVTEDIGVQLTEGGCIKTEEE